MKRVLVIVLAIFYLLPCFTQNKVNLSGEYVYHAPSNISIDEAKKIAVERAKIETLAEKFGTLISQKNFTDIKNRNNESNIDFTSLMSSQVKGRWIKDTRKPETTVTYDSGMLIVKARVWGEAQEISYAAVDFSAKILRNGTEEKFESQTFKDGDDLYLFFQSPASGYLAVYLVDDEQNAFCLLPYKNNKAGKTPVDNNKSYVFFSSKKASPEETLLVDEYSLTADNDLEYNEVYIIFSPNQFTKANDTERDAGLPRELSFAAFQKWLDNCRNFDNKIQVDIRSVEIRKQ